jgi:hypothetical protein
MTIFTIKKLGFRTFAMLLGMISIGCSSPDQKARDCLVGKWEWKSLTPVEGVFSGEVTFYADGKFHQTLTGGDIAATVISYFAGRSFLGRWTVENGELVVSWNDSHESKHVQIFSFSGDETTGLPIKVLIEHFDDHEIMFSKNRSRWICKKQR